MDEKKSRETINLEELEALPDFTPPDTQYFRTKEEFDKAVGRDFIEHANKIKKDERFLVGLSHGQSPSGPYEYILDHYEDIKHPELIRYTFVNSRLKRQRGLKGIMDARAFINALRRKGYITDEHILGTTLKRDSIDIYAKQMEQKLSAYLKKHHKDGLDYVFLASDPTGRVAAITRSSEAFGSESIGMIVHDRKEKELTATPHFLKRSKRIAFLATKADKRRPLAWLYSRWGKSDESPSFLRFIDDVDKRMTVFIDDQALTWPQLEITRETPFGDSVIRVDMAKPFNENAKRKLPVVLLIHGFLGLNTFDGLLTALPSHKYIAGAMHYGSIPHDLPIELYSKHVMQNINAVVNYFGSLGHPVYIFDHSMGNIYFLMIDQAYNELEGIKKYLRGRIGANPFFGKEAKHALLGFMDKVLIPSMSTLRSPAEKAMFLTARRVIPLDTRKGVRRRSIQLSNWLISRDSFIRDRVWKGVKRRILYLMSNIGSLPHLNRIPIERALNRLPAKVFAIQVHSALLESKAFDKQEGLVNMDKNNIPILILKSESDIVAKYTPGIYENSNAEIVDVTNYEEKDLFREHLYHMVHPLKTVEIIDNFIEKTEEQLKKQRKRKTREKEQA